MASKQKPTDQEIALAAMDAEEVRIRKRLDDVNKARDATIKAIAAINAVYQQQGEQK